MNFGYLKPKLTAKFVTASIAMLAVIFGFNAIYSINKQRRVLEQYTDTLGNSITQTVVNFSIEPLLVKDYPILEMFVGRLVSQNRNIAYINIFRHDGRLVANSQSNIADANNKNIVSYTSEVSVFNKAEENIGQVVVALHTKSLDQLVESRINESIMMSLASFVLLSLMIFFLIKYSITKRLQVLAEKASTFGDGDLNQTISSSGNDEIAALARSLEVMRNKLKDSYSKIHSQNEKLKDIGRLKDEFLSNMSHELRTPLNAVIGYSEIILEETDVEEVPGVNDAARRILQSGGHLLKIVNDILDLSKISSGTIVVSREHIGIKPLLSELREMIEPVLNGNQLQTHSHIEHENIFVDAQKLKQILLNLLNNACKFTQNGTISLNVYQCTHQQSLSYCFSVADTGIGIDRDKVSSIFESFVQADSSRTKLYGGTGLGLAISQKLALLIGGVIDVETRVGHGSTFVLMLPVFESIPVSIPQAV